VLFDIRWVLFNERISVAKTFAPPRLLSSGAYYLKRPGSLIHRPFPSPKYFAIGAARRAHLFQLRFLLSSQNVHYLRVYATSPFHELLAQLLGARLLFTGERARATLLHQFPQLFALGLRARNMILPDQSSLLSLGIRKVDLSERA